MGESWQWYLTDAFSSLNIAFISRRRVGAARSSFLLISRTECRCKLCQHIWKHVPAPVRELRTASELDGASIPIFQLWFKLKYFSWIMSKSCRWIISINFSSFSNYQGEACLNVKSGLLRVHTLLKILLQTNREWSNEILQANKSLPDNHFLAYTTSLTASRAMPAIMSWRGIEFFLIVTPLNPEGSWHTCGILLVR